MKRKILSKLTAILLATSMAATFTGCGSSEDTNLMTGIKANKVTTVSDLKPGNVNAADFAVRLFQNSQKTGKNTLISPLSVLCALAMTANGAEGETLVQMEEVLGMSVEELNAYIYSYRAQLPEGEKYKLSLANSIWFTDKVSFQADRDFLQTNADYYKADIFEAPFDNSTLKDINAWVKENTDEMILEILDEIPEAAVMYLVNALAFEAQWQSIYMESQVHDGIFTMEDGTEQKVEFMYSGEHLYLEDDFATGFVKYYKDRAYAFVALLPNEGISVAEYVSTLNGEHLNNMLANPTQVQVNAAIPKFEHEYCVEMNDILKDMGMQDAFSFNDADFSGLGYSPEGNICISRVLHKTFISVGEKGTKAGAATVVEMKNGSAAPSEIKEVYLDRPFVYMLVDCENNLPFFMGTVMNVK